MKIFGFRHRIERDRPAAAIGAFGRFNGEKLLIQIASDIARDQAVSTTLHEMLEAINFHLGMELNEKAILALEVGLFQSLTDAGVDLTPLLLCE